MLEAFQLYVKETIVTYDNMYRSALHFALRKATRDIVEAEMSHADLTQQISNKKSLEEKVPHICLSFDKLHEKHGSSFSSTKQN